VCRYTFGQTIQITKEYNKRDVGDVEQIAEEDEHDEDNGYEEPKDESEDGEDDKQEEEEDEEPEGEEDEEENPWVGIGDEVEERNKKKNLPMIWLSETRNHTGSDESTNVLRRHGPLTPKPEGGYLQISLFPQFGREKFVDS